MGRGGGQADSAGAAGGVIHPPSSARAPAVARMGQAGNFSTARPMRRHTPRPEGPKTPRSMELLMKIKAAFASSLSGATLLATGAGLQSALAQSPSAQFPLPDRSPALARGMNNPVVGSCEHDLACRVQTRQAFGLSVRTAEPARSGAAGIFDLSPLADCGQAHAAFADFGSHYAGAGSADRRISGTPPGVSALAFRPRA